MLMLSVLGLTACAARPPYDPFNDPIIKKSEVCQKNLIVLVENDVFDQVKNTIDNECNSIIRNGWIKGKINNKARGSCMGYFAYFKERPLLQKHAKKFVANSCYPKNPDKYYWK